MNVLPQVDYDGAGEESLFLRWESGEPTELQAPLSVRRPRYRRLMVGIVRRYAPAVRARIVSIGAGNGFTEAEIAAAGCHVVATDRSEVALRLCEQKGLAIAKYEFPEEPPGHLRGFDVVYGDGVLGHLWQETTGCHDFWVTATEFCRPDAWMVLSNDLSDTDAAPTFRVRTDPEARFFRPPAGWLARDAETTGLWRAVESRVFRYRRYDGFRRRELLVLRRSLVHEGII